MKIIVHRGSHEIGGSCIEVSDDGIRVLFDAGLPLESTAPASLPRSLKTRGLMGAFISHAHCDHTGLVSALPDGVPIWMTAETSKMVSAGSLFAKQPRIPGARIRTIPLIHPVQVGSIRVSAYPVDHSVYGAVAFIIEGKGKRILYTGDLRMHGRKPGMAKRLAAAARDGGIDALLIEGTRLGARSSEPNMSEASLERQILEDIGIAPGAVLAMYSPLNVDRFTTFYRAAKRSGRILVIDPYQAFVLHLVNSRSFPDPCASEHLKVMVAPRFQWSTAGRALAHTAWCAKMRARCINASVVREHPERYVVLYRDSMRSWLWPQGLPMMATCLFSYWPGYMRQEAQKTLERDIHAASGQFRLRHASGHAHENDLATFVDAIKPSRLIPVHSAAPEEWKTRWHTVQVTTDGAEIDLNEYH